MKQERNSNLELLRIFSMFFIVLYHVIYHGHVIQNSYNEKVIIISNILLCISIVHVNSFVLLTGYFQSENKFKQSKMWQIISSCLFYRIAFVVLMCILGISLTKVELSHELFILNMEEYWFLKNYLLLYCLSPFINKLINNINKIEYKRLLFACIIIFSIIPFFTGNISFFNDGYSLYNFIYLYLIGGYLKKYPIDIKKLRMKSIVIFFSCVLINYFINILSTYLLGINVVLDDFLLHIKSFYIFYSNPIIIIQTIAYFLFFTTLNFKNKVINTISTLTLGIYLIHDNNLLRDKFQLYKFLKIDNGPIFSGRFLIKIFMVAIFIYIICMVIEFIRQKLFELFKKTKFYNNIRQIYYNQINKIEIFSNKNENF